MKKGRTNLYVKSYEQYLSFLKWINKYYPEYFSLFLIRPSEAKNYIDSIKEAEAQKLLNEYENSSQYEVEHPISDNKPTIINLPGWDINIEVINHPTLDSLMIQIPVEIFTTDKKIRRILKWRCPIFFVRNFLEKEWGIKTTCIHKLFFKK